MKRIALAVAFTFAFASAILGQTADPPKDNQDTLRKLSKRERKARIGKLEVRFQDFLADVEPIALPTEIDTFLTLETDAQRDSFVDDFWRRRDALQGMTNNAFKELYYNRLEIAKPQFRNLNSDRAKMFLIHGPPLNVVRAECSRVLQPVEVWMYQQLPGLGSHVRLLFYKPKGHTEYRLWNPIGGAMAMHELVAQESAFAADAGSPRRQAGDSASPYNYISRIQLECTNGDDVVKALTQMVQSRVDLLRLFDAPNLTGEAANRLLKSVVIVNPNAPKLDAEFSVRYPAKDGSRTDVQMMLLVPREQLSPAEAGGVEMFTIDVVGEMLKEGKLWEKYRYRFDFPADTKGDKLPIVIDRLLRPNEYTSRIKVVDANGGAEAVVEQVLDVPEIFIATPERVEVASVTPVAPAPKTTDLAAAVKAPVPPSLRIIPPPEELVSGIQTFETVMEGDGIKGVEFSLDGKKIAVRRSPPYAIDLDLGTIPQMHRVRAVALDANGKPIAGDDIAVNAGTDPFRVRITSPRVAPHANGPTRVAIDVRVPDDQELGILELFWNERRVATMFDPPFVHSVDIPATDGVGYLRAVATLKGDLFPPVEDVVMINTPAYMEELNVHLVELPTTVLVGNKPTSHLTEKDFKVFDSGQPVKLSKFEYVKNLPLSIGMAIDTSGSMQNQMDEAQKAGAQFFQKVLKKGDKAFLLAFDTKPQLVQPWSTKLADMHAGLAKLRAEETTALYDALIESLYNFQSVRGQKALVLISDGKDTASRFTFEQALEYARRSAVPVYAIGIGIRTNDADVRHKLSKLCTETGGTVFYIEKAADLQKIYDEIQTELRSQYVLGFYPSPDIKSGKWREVEVKVSEGKARTVRGYYP
jgi:Ca-activated chloride channel homolog